MLHKILCGTWLYEVINVLWRFFSEINFLSGVLVFFGNIKFLSVLSNRVWRIFGDIKFLSALLDRVWRIFVDIKFLSVLLRGVWRDFFGEWLYEAIMFLWRVFGA